MNDHHRPEYKERVEELVSLARVLYTGIDRLCHDFGWDIPDEDGLSIDPYCALDDGFDHLDYLLNELAAEVGVLP